MSLRVDLGHMVAFILVDKEDISGVKGIEPIVNQKLLPSGNRIIDFITVMDVNIHDFFIVIQMGDGKGPAGQTGLDSSLTGRKSLHDNTPPD